MNRHKVPSLLGLLSLPPSFLFHPLTSFVLICRGRVLIPCPVLYEYPFSQDPSPYGVTNRRQATGPPSPCHATGHREVVKAPARPPYLKICSKKSRFTFPYILPLHDLHPSFLICFLIDESCTPCLFFALNSGSPAITLSVAAGFMKGGFDFLYATRQDLEGSFSCM